MKAALTLAVLMLACALFLVGGGRVLATAPQDYAGSGGTISGSVISPSGMVVDWSQIYARSGNQTYEAFSGFSGFYLMRVPAGTYNVSVYDFYNPQYWAPPVNVTITDGSSNTVDFHLQPQAPSPVPEFPNFSAAMVILGFAAVCVMTRRLKRRT